MYKTLVYTRAVTVDALINALMH